MMSHEPQCREYCTANDYAPCICDQLKTAYKRGREDLANQIRTAVAPFYNSPHGKYLAPLMSKIRTVIGGFDA